ncbi:MAG TPA: hypothetical protein VFN23_13040 [Ktedonobacteraceae bacterium]|nr:hypothetical protein [Ktedonobacteraceae bacterium]
MSQKKMRISVPLLSAVFLGLLAGLNWLAWKLFSKPKRPAKVVEHTVENSPEDALKYWTQDRMRQAKPAKMPIVDSLDQGKPEKRRPSDPQNA